MSEWRSNEGIEENEVFSRSEQENFVISIFNKKRNGYYVELGANHPIEGNNTYILETKFDWKGVSFEILEKHQSLHKEVRSNPCLLEDARTFDYKKYFEQNNFPKQIDYLQVDIDEDWDMQGNILGDPSSSLHGLIQLPLNEYRFSVITYEHEALNNYKRNSDRDAQREILSSYGYVLLVRNPHEDWWVDPKVFHYQTFKGWFKMAAP